MSNQHLADPLHARLCEVVLDLRFGNANGDDLVQFACELLVLEIDAPALVELASFPGGVAIWDARPVFETLLEELGYPAMDSEEAWWLEPRLQALRTDASLLPPRELLWTTLVEACPSFGPHWEPQEDFWVTVDRFAEHLASEWAEHRDAAQVKQIFDAIERALSDQKRRREVSAILEAIRDHLRRRRLPVTDFEPFLGPVTSSAWRRLL